MAVSNDMERLARRVANASKSKSAAGTTRFEFGADGVGPAYCNRFLKSFAGRYRSEVCHRELARSRQSVVSKFLSVFSWSSFVISKQPRAVITTGTNFGIEVRYKCTGI